MLSVAKYTHTDSRLYTFVTKYELLYKYQFGFRKCYSTNLALINILDNVKNYLEKENIVGIYLDLTKTFNTVQHIIHLLDKLYIAWFVIVW